MCSTCALVFYVLYYQWFYTKNNVRWWYSGRKSFSIITLDKFKWYICKHTDHRSQHYSFGWILKARWGTKWGAFRSQKSHVSLLSWAKRFGSLKETEFPSLCQTLRQDRGCRCYTVTRTYCDESLSGRRRAWLLPEDRFVSWHYSNVVL